MRILVSNDDGINSPGIRALALAMQKLGTVTVAAPETQQTAKGHSLTYSGMVSCQEVDFAEGIKGYAIGGTPKDCVDIAMVELLEEKPDLIITGINEGPNICNDCVSSGTVGSATAGFLFGIPSIAVSMNWTDEFYYEEAAEKTIEIARWFLQQPFNRDFILNVNFPSDPHYKGIVVAQNGGTHVYPQHYEKVVIDGRTYYEIVLSMPVHVHYAENLDLDLYALDNQYVTLTPLHWDMTYYQGLEQLKKAWREK